MVGWGYGEIANEADADDAGLFAAELYVSQCPDQRSMQEILAIAKKRL